MNGISSRVMVVRLQGTFRRRRILRGEMAENRPIETENDFFVRFWGVRGSIPCPAADSLRYGGNTACLEIRAGDRKLILDAGSGLRYLGGQLMAGAPGEWEMLLTHTHYDHVCGLPFFVPFFVPGWSFDVYAGHLLPEYNLDQILHELMMAPLFPVPPSIFNANINYIDYKGGEELPEKHGARIFSHPLNHPNGACGYKVVFGGKSICYLTDLEHPADGPDPGLVEFVRDTDIIIYDACYTDEEYPAKAGFGHSTWQEGAKLADAANVGTYVAFHHDPDHNDDFMDDVARQLEQRRPGSIVAREGMVLRP